MYAVLTEAGRQRIEEIVLPHQERIATYFMQYLSAAEVDVMKTVFERVLAKSEEVDTTLPFVNRV